MPGQRLPMRQVRDVLRLKHVCGHSGHQIAAMVGVSRYTAAEYLRRAGVVYLRRAGVVGITWPVPDELDDAALEHRLFSPPFAAEPSQPQPDWPRLHAELRRPGVTLQLVWRVEPQSGSTGQGSRRNMATAGSATCTRPGEASCRRPCARHTRRASAWSWTKPGRRWR